MNVWLSCGRMKWGFSCGQHLPPPPRRFTLTYEIRENVIQTLKTFYNLNCSPMEGLPYNLLQTRAPALTLQEKRPSSPDRVARTI